MKAKYRKLYAKRAVVSGWLLRKELPAFRRAARRVGLTPSKFITKLVREASGLEARTISARRGRCVTLKLYV